MKKTYFVYLNLCAGNKCKEELYAQDLTYEQANEEWEYANNMLDSMYTEYPCRSAAIGNVKDEKDYYVAERLGLIK